MSDLIYHVNGELLSADDAEISVEDRGFKYGDAAFETLRAYGGTVFEWDSHRDRLANTCDLLGMPEAMPPDLHQRVQRTLDANELDEAYIRVSITRGIQPGTITPRAEVDPAIVVLVKPLPSGGVNGENTWDSEATVRTTDVKRLPNEAIPSAAKTHNYLNGILARLEASVDEALLPDQEGYVTEGATSNLFFIQNGTLKTPDADRAVLPGITRWIVLELARSESFPVEEGQFRPADVREADEAFLTNSIWELRPIKSLDGTQIGSGPITELLRRLYDERVEAVCY